MEQLRALWKWVLSWRKREWGPSDYPLRYREQFPDAGLPVRGKLPRWNLQVINWWQMGGLGETRAEALSDFEARFAALRKTGTMPPRPGRGLPLTFATSTVIEQHEDLCRDLLSQVLDLNYNDCFISDESSLFDFVSSAVDANQLADRIESHYQLTLPERERLLISDILKAIGRARGAV
jgi:hypothetical protein